MSKPEGDPMRVTGGTYLKIRKGMLGWRRGKVLAGLLRKVWESTGATGKHCKKQ